METNSKDKSLYLTQVLAGLDLVTKTQQQGIYQEVKFAFMDNGEISYLKYSSESQSQIGAFVAFTQLPIETDEEGRYFCEYANPSYVR